MCRLSTSCPASHSGHAAPVKGQSWGGIGDLFRAYGEAYIQAFGADQRTIKLIRAVRVCRTPALGGKRFDCQGCDDYYYQFFSCGHNHCMICQGHKRRSWYERVERRLLEVPYVHLTFTLPHELNGLCRLHPRGMYNLLLRIAWQTVRQLGQKDFGGLPGMTAVLHTWGSDLKHHVHAHCLVTYGGLNEKTGSWRWPKEKAKLFAYRRINHTFRTNFLRALEAWMATSEHQQRPYHQSFAALRVGLQSKSWVVNQQPPTAEPAVINAYLSRYICRIGISDDRLVYDAQTGLVRLEYKDYRHQQPGQPPPLAYADLEPLVALQKILQHVLPPHFHRTRSYGLHAPATRKRLSGKLVQYVKAAPDTITLLFRLLKHLLLRPLPVCEHCGDMRPRLATFVAADATFKFTFLSVPQRAPPIKVQTTMQGQTVGVK